MSEEDILDIWRRFEGHGTGSISNRELAVILKQVQASIPYLKARRPLYHLAYHHACTTESRLLEYARARKMKVAS